MVVFSMPVMGMLLAASVSPAVDFAAYRGFTFGTGIEASAKIAGAKVANVRTLHERPARIEEFNWESGAYSQVDAVKVGSVRDGILRFCNGQLFQIVVTYDRQRTEGMTAADMIESISATYGAASRPTAEIPLKSIYGDLARVLARWENKDYSYALILRSKQLAALATAEKLDIKEAPSRAKALQRELDAETRLALENAHPDPPRTRPRPRFLGLPYLRIAGHARALHHQEPQ